MQVAEPDHVGCTIAEPCCDMACDLVQVALEETTSLHRSLMAESRANAQVVHALVRNTGAIQHVKPDPLEAVATDIVAGQQ